MEKQEQCPRCGHDGVLWAYDAQRCKSCKYPEPTLLDILQTLNKEIVRMVGDGALINTKYNNASGKGAYCSDTRVVPVRVLVDQIDHIFTADVETSK